MSKTSRYGGRAKRDPRPGERVHVGFRVTPELKRRLDATAEANGRSISQEAELRLERSFHHQDLLNEALALRFRNPVARLLLTACEVMDTVGRSVAYARQVAATGRVMVLPRHWTADPAAWALAIEAAVMIMDRARPADDQLPDPQELRRVAALLTAPSAPEDQGVDAAEGLEDDPHLQERVRGIVEQLMANEELVAMLNRNNEGEEDG